MLFCFWTLDNFYIRPCGDSAGYFTLLLLQLIVNSLFHNFTAQAQNGCQDKTHFNYNCWQLAVYCNTPQAVYLRQSCPRTCGICGGGVSGQVDQTNYYRTADNNVPQWPKPPSQQPKPDFVAARPQLKPALGNSANNKEDSENPTSFRGNVKPVNNSPQAAASKIGITELEAFERLKTCCSSHAISLDCLSLCTYSTTKADVLSKAIAGSCTLDDARIWVQCAANGKNNVQCCRNYGIYGCDNICKGEIGSDFAQLLTCVDNYLETILKCHRNGLSFS